MLLRALRERQRRRYLTKRYPNAHPLAKQSPTGVPEDLAPRAPWLKSVRHLDPLGPVRDSPIHSSIERLVPREQWEHAQLLHESDSVRRLCNDGLVNTFTLGEAYFDRTLQTDIRSLTSPEVSVSIASEKRPLELELRMAETWLQINHALLADGLGLLDAHDGNFGVDDSLHPVWIDHGSIVHVHNPLLGLHEFLETRLFPAAIRIRHPALGELLRGKRISWVAYWEIRPFSGSLLAMAFALKRVLSAGPSIWRRKDPSSAISPSEAISAPSVWMVRLRRIILALLNFAANRLRRSARASGFWSDYRPDSAEPALATRTERDRTIISTAASLEWSSCTDIGANAGHHVLGLATVVEGARRFTAVDPDDFALSKFVRAVETLEVPHTFSAQLGSLFSDSDPADLVLALALTHHLALQQHYPLDAIAGQLALRSRKYCIVEFMPMGLTTTERVLASRHAPTPNWYSEANFVAAMARHFHRVSEIGRTYFGESDIPHRIAFLAANA